MRRRCCCGSPPVGTDLYVKFQSNFSPTSAVYRGHPLSGQRLCFINPPSAKRWWGLSFIGAPTSTTVAMSVQIPIYGFVSYGGISSVTRAEWAQLSGGSGGWQGTRTVTFEWTSVEVPGVSISEVPALVYTETYSRTLLQCS